MGQWVNGLWGYGGGWGWWWEWGWVVEENKQLIYENVEDHSNPINCTASIVGRVSLELNLM